jgi:hypothetical protein
VVCGEQIHEATVFQEDAVNERFRLGRKNHAAS